MNTPAFKAMPDALRAVASDLPPFKGPTDSRTATQFLASFTTRYKAAKSAVTTEYKNANKTLPTDMDAAYGRCTLRACLGGAAGEWFDTLLVEDDSVYTLTFDELCAIIKTRFTLAPAQRLRGAHEYINITYYKSPYNDMARYHLYYLSLTARYFSYTVHAASKLEERLSQFARLDEARRALITSHYIHSLPLNVQRVLERESVLWKDELQDNLHYYMHFVEQWQARNAASDNSNSNNNSNNTKNNNGGGRDKTAATQHRNGNNGNGSGNGNGNGNGHGNRNGYGSGSGSGNDTNYNHGNNGNGIRVVCKHCFATGHDHDECRVLKRRERYEQQQQRRGNNTATTAATTTTSTTTGVVNVVTSTAHQSTDEPYATARIRVTTAPDTTLWELTAVFDSFAAGSFINDDLLPAPWRAAMNTYDDDCAAKTSFTSATGDPLSVLGHVDVRVDDHHGVRLYVTEQLNYTQYGDVLIGARDFIACNVNMYKDERNITPGTVTNTDATLDDTYCTSNDELLAIHFAIDELPLPALKTDAERQRARAILRKHATAVYTPSVRTPPMDGIEHDIELAPDAKPVHVRARRIPDHKREVFKTHIDKLLSSGAIRRATPTAWCAPVVLATKKTGGTRFCVDYTAINKFTVPDTYHVPAADHVIERAAHSALYTLLDLKDAFHCIKMTERASRLSTFATPYGSFQWLRMPFGFCTAPATFARAIDQALAHLADDVCVHYFDDVLVLGSTLEEHLHNIDLVLGALERNHLRITLNKCVFIALAVEFLGHTISQAGLQITPTKCAALLNVSAPTTTSDVRSFLGAASYLRRFVFDFARRTSTLRALTKKDAEFVWTPAHQQQFDDVRTAIANATVLIAYDYQEHHRVRTDACIDGISAVLEQRQAGGSYAPVEFFSRSLSPAERNYAVHEQEALAIIAGLNHYRHRLIVPPRNEHERVVVLTDSQWCATTLMSPAATEHSDVPRRARWRELLVHFNPIIKHTPGLDNALADYLSRHPLPPDSTSTKTIDELEDDVAGLNMHVLAAPPPTATVGIITRQNSTLCTCPGNKLHATCRAASFKCSCAPPCIKNTCACQAGARMCTRHCTCTISDACHTVINTSSSTGDDSAAAAAAAANKTDTTQHANAAVGTPTQTVQHARTDNNTDQLAHKHQLPAAAFRNTPPRNDAERLGIIFNAHERALHPSAPRTIDVLRNELHADWPTLDEDVRQFVRTCDTCQRYKPYSHAKPNTMNTVVTLQPLELVHIDLITNMTPTASGNKIVLTIVDAFTRYGLAVALPHAEAPLVSSALFDTLFMRFGFPNTIISDEGTNLTSDELSTLCNKFGVQRVTTARYHPAANGTCERFNATLVKLLRISSRDTPSQWDLHVPHALFVYNGTAHSATGHAPYTLMFGRRARLLPDIMLKWDSPSRNTTASFTNSSVLAFSAAADAMREAHELLITDAQRTAADNQQRRRAAFDKQHAPRAPTAGDLVLVRRFTPSPGAAKLKMGEQYEGPFVVLTADASGTLQLGARNDLLRRTARTEHVSNTKLYHVHRQATNAGGPDDSARRDLGERRLHSSSIDFMLDDIDHTYRADHRATSQTTTIDQRLEPQHAVQDNRTSTTDQRLDHHAVQENRTSTTTSRHDDNADASLT